MKKLTTKFKSILNTELDDAQILSYLMVILLIIISIICNIDAGIL